MSNLYFALRRKWLCGDVSSLRLGLGSWRETQQATSQRIVMCRTSRQKVTVLYSRCYIHLSLLKVIWARSV